MAYGVKYRLEFSDNKENKKKIEILKDGYTGSVLPMVATENPCVISWEKDDDIYSPIIGSSATVNLFVTDTVSYDNFYEFDEREYQLKVSYWDGSAYQTYWLGWITTDTYLEAITSTPYQISLKALDGLGTLSKYETPLYDNGASNPLNTAKPPITYFADILNNLGLGFDIYTSTELITTASTTEDIYENLWSNITQGQKASYGFINDNKVNDAKTTLETILRFTHSKVFQSYGRWYIINASGYSEQSIKDDLIDSTFSGSSVRDAETAYLQANNEENIKYKIYNSSGTYQSTSTVDVLSQVPSDLQPLNRDLVKEYSRPINSASIQYDMTRNLFLVKHNYQFFWDNDNANNVGWQTGGNCEFSTDETIYRNAIKFYGSSGSFQSYTDGQTLTSRTYELKLRSYTDYSSQRLDVTIRSGSSGSYRYYTISTQSWGTIEVANQINLQKTGEWETITKEITNVPYSNDPFIKITAPNSTTTNTVFIGDLIWTYKDFESTNLKTQTRTLTRNSGDYSASIDFEKLTISNQIGYEYVLGGSTLGFRRPYDRFYGGNKDMAGMKLQYVLNDHRDNLVKYDGTFYNNNVAPISLHNKVWINFGTSVLQEPVSCYIDGMTYNVKMNEYQLNMHVPNQDNDLAATLSIQNT